jgi:thiol-disulfide isomerase/thioredoxin
MNKIVLLCLALMPISSTLFCALPQQAAAITPPVEGYAIDILPHGIQAGDTLLLKAYYGDETRAVDTVLATRSRRAVFSGNQPLPAGMYCISVANVSRHLDFFISEDASQHFRIVYALVGGLASAYFDGSPENAAFADFYRLSMEENARLQLLQQEMAKYDYCVDSIELFNRKIEAALLDMEHKRDSLEKTYKGTLFSMFLAALQEAVPPAYHPSDERMRNESLERDYHYAFLKEHFFDGYDFSSPYILRMPVYTRDVDRYFQLFLRPEANELKEGLSLLLKKAEGNVEVYKYTVNRLSHLFWSSNDPLMTDMGLYLAEQYIIQRPDIWQDAVYIAFVKEFVAMSKLNPVGAIATDLVLQNTFGRLRSLHSIQSAYTVLYFYSPSCSSCDLVTPQLYALYQKYKGRGLQVYAVYVDHNLSEWASYIGAKGLSGWINVWNPDPYDTGIYELYNIQTLPVIYLLDDKKAIIAKNLYIDALDLWLAALLK